jgi:lipopolysaccharide/colanic/teichoic acid biosynthesis glycosyltransferase
MSLVGPRPPRPEEMAGADVEAMRRLLVRPGMTGLWQVLRDREHVSWDESVRLDLRYVENWSLTLDAAILLRTARSLVHRARTCA